jgi:hypothetical protein
MAEVKNSFLQSKMNKDLDNRLVPNGEYRDALNISVGKSEDKDVGALEAVLGNEFIAANNPNNNELVCIGQVADNQNNRIFQFWTTYKDPKAEEPTQATSGDMRITMYNANSPSNLLITLVSGLFLNFASNSQFRINGANILENLLFWTDNRNQPRKINILKAKDNPSYYTTEVQISVAKYAPVSPISLYRKVKVYTTSVSSNPTPISTSFSVSSTDIANLSIGMQLVGTYASLDSYAVITNISGNVVTVSFSTNIPTSSQIYFYGSTMSSESDNPNWPGDPNYLKDKYVRFSYRYKYEDGEYSLMAPFTQILYIPNQNGYFLSGDENSAYRSTVVSWMENYVNNVVLNIELPDTGINIASSYKIASIDILYKESDAVAVKVLETIGVNQIRQIADNTNLYHYDYKSQKPYKTLPESQTVRVYDKTPVRARTQEIVGNRVIYGNFVNQNTPPISINYNLAVIEKTNAFTSWAEYPNHTLKQNRNYQAGIILSDKFGRQSSVILSSNDLITESNGIKFGGSTIYSPYAVESALGNNAWVKSWRGNTLAMLINSQIVSTKSEGTGEPGLYATVSGSISGSTDGFQIISLVIPSIPNTYSFTLSPDPAHQKNIPKIGNYLRGKYTDYVKVTNVTSAYTNNYVVTTDGPINDAYNYTGVDPDIKFSYDINPLGWYSYKIVVRQQQQEYYNVYLPGVLNGYPMYQKTLGGLTIFPTTEVNKTAHVVLLNDNINKVPRDLVEVGPDQKQYRSSVELFGRVENTLDTALPYSTNNKQYYPSRKADVASTIATSNDLNFLITDTDNANSTASNNFYQLNTAPAIARISTVERIGVIATTAASAAPPLASKTMNPYLSVYETAPVVSALDLFWESTTAGLLSDLNEAVLQGSNITVDFSSLTFNFNEFQNAAGGSRTFGTQQSPYICSYFEPINNIGVVVGTVTNILMAVTDGDGGTRDEDFELFKETVGIGTGQWVIKIRRQFTFLKNAGTKESYTFTFTVIDPQNGNTTIVKTGSLKNSVPVISAPTPGTIVPITNPIGGPIYSCTGTNGALQTPDLTFNKQELQWSILPTSTTSWENFYEINPSSGVISLKTADLVTATEFTLNIRLTDAYDYTLNTPGTGSLYADTSITFKSPTGANTCGTWESYSEYDPVLDGGEVYAQRYYLNVGGLGSGATAPAKLDLWKMLLPGETISAIESTARITSYGVAQSPIEVSSIPVAPPDSDVNRVRQDVNTNKLYKYIYNKYSGRISFSSNSTLVTGVQTSFLSELNPGDVITVIYEGGGIDYFEWLSLGTVQTVNSNTSLTLVAPTTFNNTPRGPDYFTVGPRYWEERYFGQDLSVYNLPPANGGSFTYDQNFIASFNIFRELPTPGYPSFVEYSYAALVLYFGGDLVTKIGANTSRVIQFRGESVYDTFIADSYVEKRNCANVYRAPGLQSWSLINNGQSVINWRALVPAIAGNSNYPIAQTIGGALAPGESIKSISTYNGNQKCISPNSLVYGVGGFALFSSCV